MTRTLTILAVVLLLAVIGSLVVGFAAIAPGVLISGLLCALPLFMLTLGAVLGRISNELVITRKERSLVQPNNTRINPAQRERRVPESFS